MTPPWVLIVVACITVVGVLASALLTYLVNDRTNRQVQARWEADRRSLETKWRTELDALEERAHRASEDDERKNKRTTAIDLSKWAAGLAVSDNPKQAETGVNTLIALLEGSLLDEDLKPVVEAALISSFAEPTLEIESLHGSTPEVTVSQLIEDNDSIDVVLKEDE